MLLQHYIAALLLMRSVFCEAGRITGFIAPAGWPCKFLAGASKIRHGDVLGALTGEAGYTAAQVAKINVGEFLTYAAVARDTAEDAQHDAAHRNALTQGGGYRRKNTPAHLILRGVGV
jgi:hypothetical protein